MANNASLSLTSLDVDTLQTALKAYMRSQDAFKDYDYEGSNMSALIRLLAYNTYLNNFYLNGVHTESFLDSAQLRSSVVSIAKELNYTPRSARSARAQITLTFNGSDSSYLIEKGSSFSSVVKSSGMTFTFPDPILATSSNGFFSVNTYLYEGAYVADSYVVDYSDETQRFVLTNPEVDTTSLTVVVYEDGDITGTTYSRRTTLLDLDEADEVYFLQAAETGQYEVVFGDGVVGTRPADGSTVVFDYRVTRGEAGNGAKVFSIDFEIGDGVSNVRTTTVATAADGAPAETIPSIKYYAPRHFQVQERAVTASDYEVLLRTEFPEIQSVSVYGGEEADPPQYGRVIVALDIEDVDGIPDAKKREYENFLRRRCGLTIRPILVEPAYTYLSIRALVSYNINVTTLTPENLAAVILTEVESFAAEFLNDFNATMRFSKLVAHIDAADDSIVGNQTEVLVYKKVDVRKQNIVQVFDIDFGMPLYDGYPESGTSFPTRDRRTLRSQDFILAGSLAFLTDDGDGNVWVGREQGDSTILFQKVGTIDYGTGAVSVSNFQVDSYDGNSLKLYAKTAEQDVVSSRDTILSVESDEILITVEVTRE
jgi:hypothetical protein